MATNLGRFQLGQTVHVEATLPSLPDAYPIGSIDTGPSTTVLSRSPLGWASGTTFQAVIFLGPGLGLGSYRAMVAYSIAGTPTTTEFDFEVVAGGDPNGPVIAMYAVDRPGGRYVLAQLGGGRIVAGRNPKL